MRTTVDIPDVLHRKLKAKAASEGVTVKDVLLRLIERELGMPNKHRVRFPLMKAKEKRVLDLTNDQIDDILFG